jgi:hypothetical protein
VIWEFLLVNVLKPTISNSKFDVPTGVWGGGGGGGLLSQKMSHQTV